MTKFHQLEVCMIEFKNDNFMTKFRQLEGMYVLNEFGNDKFFMTTTHMEQVSSTRKYASTQENDKFSSPLPTWNKFHQLEVCINSRE